jgi:hypothetical protein
MLPLAIDQLGIIATLFSGVIILVLKILIVSTIPSSPCDWT